MRVLVLLLITASTCLGQDQPSLILGEGLPWQTPVFVNDSGVDGPTVIVTGGVHGNEPSGAASAGIRDALNHPLARCHCAGTRL